MEGHLNIDDLDEEDQITLRSLFKSEPDLITDEDAFGGKLYLGNQNCGANADLKKYGISVVIQI